MGLFVACERDVDSIIDTDEEVVLDDVGNVVSHDDENDYTWNSADIIPVVLNGTSISIANEAAVVEGSKITITKAGTYSLSGTLIDGQVYVCTQDNDIVRLIFDGVNITCSSNAPVYIDSSAKTMIVLADDSENFITDGSLYSADEEDANAAIFSKDDLTLYGNGSLTVNGNYQDGITSKDGLVIASGNITVNAVDDGIRGKDYLVVKDGVIVVNAGGDGLKSDNDESAEKGYITIDGGSLDITSGGDALTAETDVLINYGEINIVSGGGSTAYISASLSAKGIKSGVSTIINDGTISINAADDAIHTDGDQEVTGAILTIASGDDAIHSEFDTKITAGEIYITKAYEGIESALGNIDISGGDIYIVSSDDAINISAGGTTTGGGPGHKSTTIDYALIISGGYIVINCEGDGLDSNDQLTITGGTQLVNGPTANSNSALDYDGACVMNAGFLVAVGSSQMAEAPGTSSSQYSILINFSSQLQGGNIIHIQEADGNEILTFETAKAFQSIAFSSADLKNGSTYEVYIGGSSTGTVTDGLYEDGTYSGGALKTSFTITSKVTTKNL